MVTDWFGSRDWNIAVNKYLYSNFQYKNEAKALIQLNSNILFIGKYRIDFFGRHGPDDFFVLEGVDAAVWNHSNHDI